jgi:tetratricopeptide (TPR) repeat protein
LTYISAYNAWYCYPCKKYSLPKGQQPAQNAQAQAAGADGQQQAGQAASAAASGHAQSEASQAGAAAGEARAAQPSKCADCGAPLPASGECNHCKAKELLGMAEESMANASTAGVEVRKAEQLVRDARNSLEEGNFGEARSSAEKALSLVKELETQFTKGKEQIAEAEGVVAGLRSRQVDVGQADSLIQLSQSFLKTGNYEKAVAYAKKAIKTANEAQTRQVAEKAIGDRPPLPPAVAVPVEQAPSAPSSSEAVAAPVAEKALSKPVVVAPKSTEPAAKAGEAPKCPGCGEPVEAGWKRCPNCTTQLGGPAVATAPVQPAGGGMTATASEAKDPEYLAAEKEIKEVGAELEKLEKRGENVAHARNLLKLAVSFLRGGSYEKATRYTRKVRNVLDEKKEE